MLSLIPSRCEDAGGDAAPEQSIKTSMDAVRADVATDRQVLPGFRVPIPSIELAIAPEAPYRPFYRQRPPILGGRLVGVCRENRSEARIGGIRRRGEKLIAGLHQRGPV